jgi:hypothetical protein
MDEKGFAISQIQETCAIVPATEKELFLRSYNSTKTDRRRAPFLVGPHTALCMPTQDLAQLRLSLNQAALPRLRQFPVELSLPLCARSSTSSHLVILPAQPT